MHLVDHSTISLKFDACCKLVDDPRTQTTQESEIEIESSVKVCAVNRVSFKCVECEMLNSTSRVEFDNSPIRSNC